VTTTSRTEAPPCLTQPDQANERARANAESDSRLAAMLETLGQIGHEITANLDAVAVFQAFTAHVRSLLPASAFGVWLLDAPGERLMLAFGIEDDVVVTAPDIRIDDVHSPAARAVREQREIFDAVRLPNDEPPDRLGRSMQTELFAPLVVANRVLGVVCIGSEMPAAYTAYECSLFRTVTTFAAIALDNSAAYRKLEQSVHALKVAQTELARQTAEFERLSMTDALTGVANRRQLHDRAQIEIAEILRRPGELSVAMFDIDHFKRVNDTHGHAVGDAVLHRIAQVAKGWLRPADLIARVGGEEFVLLLPGAGVREAVGIAERIRASIAGTVVVVGTATVRVTSSFGVATFDPASDTLDHALSRADRALYAAKLAGRDRVLATPSNGAER
jgi:diguanylate cyclase (GGDEF)-like protein